MWRSKADDGRHFRTNWWKCVAWARRSWLILGGDVIHATRTLWDGVFGQGGINLKHRKMQQTVVEFSRVMTRSCSNFKQKAVERPSSFVWNHLQSSQLLHLLLDVHFRRMDAIIQSWWGQFTVTVRREICKSLWVQPPKRNSTSLGATGSVCVCVCVSCIGT